MLIHKHVQQSVLLMMHLQCVSYDEQISTIKECKAAVQCAGGIFVDAMDEQACVKDGLLITAGDTPIPANARMARSLAQELGVRFENFNRRVLIMTGDFVEDLEAMGCYQIMKSCGFHVRVLLVPK